MIFCDYMLMMLRLSAIKVELELELELEISSRKLKSLKYIELGPLKNHCLKVTSW